MQRRSATLKAFDAVAFLAIPDTLFVHKPVRLCGQLEWARPMMFSQLVEICRQLVESRSYRGYS